jgi:transcriptional regulator GlxA family with amidase domain
MSRIKAAFVAASHFSTCYRQLYGKTPRAERAAIA